MSAHKWDEGKVLRLPYECLETLPGGLREVRRWYDPLTDQTVVGKRLDLTMVDSNVLMEQQVLAAVRHDHVVPILTAAEIDGYPPPMHVIEIVMPYYRRGSVADALLRGERFGTHQAIALAQGALLGLGELHERHRVLHRDVKSSNLLITDDGRTLRVGDLGLAGRMDDDGSAPALDNPQLYSPPELVATGKWTRASDLFAMGIVLRELLLGPLPYDTYKRTDMLEKLARGHSPIRPRDRALGPWVPRPLQRIIKRATQPLASRRYQSAREMTAALASARVPDWAQTCDGRWEAPHVYRPSRRVAVVIEPSRKGVKVDVLSYRTTWRRACPTTVSSSAEHAQVAEAFAHAANIAFER
jgi:serine/threonine protein kinase